MSGYGTMSSFSLNASIRTDKHWSHQAKRSVSLSNNIRLDITVIVLASPDESSIWFNSISNHIINQSVFIPQPFLQELRFVGIIVQVLEDVLEPSIILLKDSILCAQVQRIVSVQGILEGSMSESNDWFISVVHAHKDSSVFEVEDIIGFLLWSIRRNKLDLKLAWFVHY